MQNANTIGALWNGQVGYGNLLRAPTRFKLATNIFSLLLMIPTALLNLLKVQISNFPTLSILTLKNN
jgi:hypothetical protein